MRLLLPVLLALAAWVPSVWIGGWALDDREAIFGNPVVEGTLPVLAAFERDYFHHLVDTGGWRPLASLSLRLDRAVFEDDPRGFHATNVVLHALVTALAALLVVRLARGASNVPLLGVCVFAAHPALADSVAWVSGRTSMLSVVPVLAGALGVAAIAARGSRNVLQALGLVAVTSFATFFAAAGKEDAALLGLVLLPLVALRSAPPGRAHFAAFLAFAGAALGVAAALVAKSTAVGVAMPHAPFAPLAGEPLLARLAVGGAAWIEGARIAATPIGYPPQHDLVSLRAAVPLAAPLTIVLGLALCGALAVGPWLARRSLVGWSAALVALVAAPWLQVVPAGELLAPRFLYLPLLVGAPLVGAALATVFGGHARTATLVVVLAALPAAWQRSGVYASRASYRIAVLAQSPTHAPSWNDLGLAFEEAGEVSEALAAWEHAAKLDPRYSKPWSNLGRVQMQRGELERAAASLTHAVELHPRNHIAHVNLGSVFAKLGRPEDAAASYQRATELARGLAPAWRGLGLARLRSGDTAGARAAFERVLELDPGDATVRRELDRIR